MKKPRILLVDDDRSYHARYADALAPTGAEVEYFATAPAALDALTHAEFDVLITALNRPQLDGLVLAAKAREHSADLAIILVTAEPNVQTATDSLRLGVADYLPKPLDERQLAASVTRVLAQQRVVAENTVLRRQIERPYSLDDFIGACPAMRKVFATVEQVADSDVDVLVQGETGTGKELIARSLHRRSRRAEKPFVPVDCGAIPENLMESEFFGHERGAFTGAEQRTLGLLEFADGGTLFLDELGELPSVLQAKLLRTLQERKIRRVGGREEIDVDLRVVAATARDLEAMIRDGQFRMDLYYRINVVRIELPPLRDRGDDLGLLAEHFAARYAKEMGKGHVHITPEAYQVLSQYRWSGNVRELQNVIRRAMALSTDRMIGLDDLPDALVVAAGERNKRGDNDELARGYFEQRDDHLARFERQYLVELLTRHHGDVKHAAREAQLPRGTLYRLLKNHSLDVGHFRT